ncbi:hypothetical protein D3C87_332250 [compost metagenome]|jgi:hypothetical protein
MDEESTTPVPAQAVKKPSLTTYIVITILVLVVASFAVECIAALKEGRSINFELINKLLDTLLSLMNTPSPTA